VIDFAHPRPKFARAAITYLISPIDAARVSFAALTAPAAGAWAKVQTTGQMEVGLVDSTAWAAILAGAVNITPVTPVPWWPGPVYVPAGLWITGQVASIGQGWPLVNNFGSLMDWWWVAPGNTLWVAPAGAAGPLTNSALRAAAVHVEALNADEFAQLGSD
jgi:hypothetical protein